MPVRKFEGVKPLQSLIAAQLLDASVEAASKNVATGFDEPRGKRDWDANKGFVLAIAQLTVYTSWRCGKKRLIIFI